MTNSNIFADSETRDGLEVNVEIQHTQESSYWQTHEPSSKQLKQSNKSLQVEAVSPEPEPDFNSN